MSIHKNNIKNTLFLILVIAILTLSGCKINKTTKEMPPSLSGNEELEEFGISIGEKAPDFELKTYDGNTIRLSDYRGNPVVLNFFATWCPFCNNEMPRLQKIVNEKYSNVKIIAIDDAFEDATTIEKWANEKGFEFPLLVDPDGKVKALYAIRSHPTTIYIDEKGIIKDKRYGSGTNAAIEENLKKIAA